MAYPEVMLYVLPSVQSSGGGEGHCNHGNAVHGLFRLSLSKPKSLFANMCGHAGV